MHNRLQCDRNKRSEIKRNKFDMYKKKSFIIYHHISDKKKCTKPKAQLDHDYRCNLTSLSQ